MSTEDPIPQVAATAALIRAIGLMSAPKKDTQNPHLRSWYASLASILAVARGPLAECGLALLQDHTIEGDQLTLHTRVAHSSGYVLDTRPLAVPIAKDHRSPIQAIGAASTYARRYALLALLSLAPDDDDDGEPQRGPQRGPDRRRPREPAGSVWLLRKDVQAWHIAIHGGPLGRLTPDGRADLVAWLERGGGREVAQWAKAKAEAEAARESRKPKAEAKAEAEAEPKPKPQEWSKTDRGGFFASLGKITQISGDELKGYYSDLATYCEANGRPRPSRMAGDQRVNLLGWLRTDAGRETIASYRAKAVQ